MRFYNFQTDRVIESLPWQDSLKPSDYYLIEKPFVGVFAAGVWEMVEELGCPVIGQILDAEDCEPGFFHVRAYSSICPGGEEGVISIVDPSRILSPDAFEAAQRANWLLE